MSCFITSHHPTFTPLLLDNDRSYNSAEQSLINMPMILIKPVSVCYHLQVQSSDCSIFLILSFVFQKAADKVKTTAVLGSQHATAKKQPLVDLTGWNVSGSETLAVYLITAQFYLHWKCVNNVIYCLAPPGPIVLKTSMFVLIHV